MSVNNNKYKFVKSNLDQYINLPIEIKWDFGGRDDSIDNYENEVVREVAGLPFDFEVSRFSHEPYGQNKETKINYDFYFFSGNSGQIPSSTSSSWKVSYLNEGFTPTELYYFANQFTRSFFKLDFYDTKEAKTQKNYFTVILPVQQGLTETATISPYKPSIQIKKPSMFLDFVGDKEGFFLYWLRKKNFLDINTFYMTAKFFDARLGVFVKMMNSPQSTLTSNKFNFDTSRYYYYKVVLDYTKNTYQIFDYQNVRIGTGTPIKWYEYVNP
jgi:hypothetical protein